MNIIITGASRGIGYELVKLFSSDSQNKIIAISRNHEKLQELKQECLKINPITSIVLLSGSITDSDFQKKLIPELKLFNDSVDILINNAGVLVNKPLIEINEKDFNTVFDVNVKGVFSLIQGLLSYFKVNSHIINISSIGGVQGSVKFPGLSVYSASKGALAVLTECLAEELKDQSIKVNCLALGAVQTEMLEEAFPGYEAPVKAVEMAKYIRDFAINGHKFYNGKILPVSLSTP